MRVICIVDNIKGITYMQPYNVIEVFKTGSFLRGIDNCLYRLNEDGYELSECPDAIYAAKYFSPTESQEDIVVEDTEYEVIETILTNP